MRILVNETGAVATQHLPEEFELLRRHVVSGNLSVSAAQRHQVVEGGPDAIGPRVVTAESAQLIARATETSRNRIIARTALAKSALETACLDADPTAPTVVHWSSPEHVAAVRSQVVYGLLEMGTDRGILLGGAQELPGGSLT